MGGDNAVFGDGFPFPPRDHSCVGRNLLAAGNRRWRQIERRCRPVKNRFLPTQEWSAGGLWFVGGFGDGVCDNLSGCRFAAFLLYAGMVHGGNGNRGRILATAIIGVGGQQCQNTPIHFRPTQDHSCVGRNLLAMGSIAA